MSLGKWGSGCIENWSSFYRNPDFHTISFWLNAYYGGSANTTGEDYQVYYSGIQ